MNEQTQTPQPQEPLSTPSVDTLPRAKWPRVVLIVAFLLVASVGVIWQTNRSTNPNRFTDRQEFRDKYGISTPITIEGNFIYFRYPSSFVDGKLVDSHLQLVVSDASGQVLKVIKEFEPVPDNVSILRQYPSPLGSYYYMRYMDGFSNIYGLYNLVGEKVLTLERDLQDPATIGWSNDERYFAEINSYSEKPSLFVYDVLNGKKIFEEDIGPLKEPGGYINKNNVFIADPISTTPRISWGDDSNVLYTFNDRGIKIIDGFELSPSSRFATTTAPCHGLVSRKNEIFCHSELSTIWPTTVNPATTTRTGNIYKYTLSDYEIIGPQPVSLTVLEGEYDAEMFFLNQRHLLYVPSLGPLTIVDVETGRMADGGWPWSGDEEALPVFKGIFNADARNSGQIPIRYRLNSK